MAEDSLDQSDTPEPRLKKSGVEKGGKLTANDKRGLRSVGRLRDLGPAALCFWRFFNFQNGHCVEALHVLEPSCVFEYDIV